MKRLEFHEDYFDPRSFDLEQAYWAGLIAADGCIQDKGVGQRRIVLKSIDRELVQGFAEAIDFHGAISEVKPPKGRTCFYIQPSSNRLAEDLKKLGIAPRKTWSHKAPSLKGQIALAFIKGYVDGDGCIHRKKSGWIALTILGRRRFLKWMLAVLGCKGTRVTHRDGVWRFTVNDRQACEVASRIRDSVPLGLERKWGLVPREICLERTKWTTNEILFLQNNRHRGLRVCAAELGRSYAAAKSRNRLCT